MDSRLRRPCYETINCLQGLGDRSRAPDVLHDAQHRDAGPAVEHADGTREWWLNGELHREDGPAIEHADGTRSWRLHGKRHRDDGPATEGADGTREWWGHGKRHREDGPALERADGTRSWWLDTLMPLVWPPPEKLPRDQVEAFASSLPYLDRLRRR
jgi:hypothetical protein